MCTPHSLTLAGINEIPRPVDVFVTYDGRRAPDIAVSRYAVRHLIATEVCGVLFLFFIKNTPNMSQIDAALVTQTVTVENVTVKPRILAHRGSVLAFLPIPFIQRQL